MQQVGAFLTTAEQVAFQLAGSADHPRRVVGDRFMHRFLPLLVLLPRLGSYGRFSPCDSFSHAACQNIVDSFSTALPFWGQTPRNLTIDSIYV